jgi:hypothetical protein
MGLFPEPKHFEPVNGKFTIHQRARVVIHQASRDDAIALAEKLSAEQACDVEVFVAFVDDTAEESRGEVVVLRRFFPNKGAMEPATESEPANAN